MFSEDDLLKKLNIFLEKNGIDPIYFFTVVCIISAISFWPQYKDWKNIEYWRKGLALSSALGAITLTIISLLKLFKIIDF
jgi:hypothetical protein